MVRFNGVDIKEDYIEIIFKLALEQASLSYAEEYKKLKLIQYEAISQHDARIFDIERDQQMRVDYYNNIIDQIMRLARNIS